MKPISTWIRKAEACERDHEGHGPCFAVADYCLNDEPFCSDHIAWEAAQSLFAAKIVAGMLTEVGVR